MSDESKTGERLLRAWQSATSRAVPPAALDELVNAELHLEEIRIDASAERLGPERRERGIRGGSRSGLKLAAVVCALVLAAGLGAWGSWLMRPAPAERSTSGPGGSGGWVVSVEPKRLNALPGAEVVDLERTSASSGWALFRIVGLTRLATTLDAGATWYDVTPHLEGYTETIVAADGRGSNLWVLTSERASETVYWVGAGASPTQTADESTYTVELAPNWRFWQSADGGRTWRIARLDAGLSIEYQAGDSVYSGTAIFSGYLDTAAEQGLLNFGSDSTGLLWFWPLGSVHFCRITMPIERIAPEASETVYWLDECDQAPAGYLYETRDGGGSWLQLATPPDVFTSLTMVDGRSAYALGAKGVWRTIDGGETWNTVSPLPLGGPPLKVTRAAFADADHGMAIAYDNTVPVVNGSSPPTSSLLYVTADGGATWQATVDVDTYSILTAPDPKHWFALQSDGHLWHSSDAGATWSRSDAAVLPAGCTVSFADASHGWALDQQLAVQYEAGLGGNPTVTSMSVYTTDDGGLTWTKLDTFPTTEWPKNGP
jgi:hypothetical protein